MKSYIFCVEGIYSWGILLIVGEWSYMVGLDEFGEDL